MKKFQNNRGISLTELSIVIAVIGLLTAATIAGIGIRKSSEIRSFMTDISGFQISIDGFDSKYSDLPGDMSDAYDNWATSCAASPDPCNGDSNGKIVVNATDGTDSEAFRAWQHLVLSEFANGIYSGVAPTSNIQADIGINIPPSKRVKVGYSIAYSATNDRNEITLGGFYTANINTNAALTPQEALVIDKKMDDGIPLTGIIRGADGSDASGNCVNGSGGTSTYKTSVTKASCIQTFPIK